MSEIMRFEDEPDIDMDGKGSVSVSNGPDGDEVTIIAKGEGSQGRFVLDVTMCLRQTSSRCPFRHRSDDAGTIDGRIEGHEARAGEERQAQTVQSGNA